MVVGAGGHQSSGGNGSGSGGGGKVRGVIVMEGM